MPRLGMLGMDPHRRVRWLDGGAERMLEQCQGVTLCGARLHFDDAAASRNFERLLRRAGQTPTPMGNMLRLAQHEPPGMLSLRLLPHPAPTQGPPTIMVSLRRTSPVLDSDSATAMPTPRQGEVLTLLAQGLMSKQISAQLGIAENTVRNHVHGLLDLLQVPNRTACVTRAREVGWLD
jgi:DNA-binding CsgD family transcriptional regulator